MGNQDNSAATQGLKYATRFDQKLLGTGCDVDVTVDLVSGQARAVVRMRALLRSSPAFEIALPDLKAVAAAIQTAKAKVKLLDALVDGADDHQFNYDQSGASLIVVKPPKKDAMAVLTIGSFNRECALADLSDKELTQAISTIEALVARVQGKLGAVRG